VNPHPIHPGGRGEGAGGRVKNDPEAKAEPPEGRGSRGTRASRRERSNPSSKNLWDRKREHTARPQSRPREESLRQRLLSRRGECQLSRTLRQEKRGPASSRTQSCCERAPTRSLGRANSAKSTSASASEVPLAQADPLARAFGARASPSASRCWDRRLRGGPGEVSRPNIHLWGEESLFRTRRPPRGPSAKHSEGVIPQPPPARALPGRGTRTTPQKRATGKIREAPGLRAQGAKRSPDSPAGIESAPRAPRAGAEYFGPSSRPPPRRFTGAPPRTRPAQNL